MLADALALEPRLAMADADPEADQAALEALADWCVRFSPAVALDPPEGLILDVTGAQGLWGGEQALAEDFAARLEHNGIAARVGLAASIGAAWALSRYGEDETTVAPPEADLRTWLAPLPLAALRLEPDAVHALARLGIANVGALMALPRGELTRRFGPVMVLRLDQALGAAEEVLTWRRPPPAFFERLAFFEPIGAPEDMVQAASDILHAMAVRLAAAGRGGRRFELDFHRVDGRTLSLSIGTARPSRDPKRLAKLFAGRIETVDPGFGIEAVTLSVDRVEGLAERQGSLTDEIDPDAAGDGPEALVDRLVNRLGEERVWRPAPFESWLPERAVTRAAPLAAPALETWPAGRPRPIRLFRRPEPIEAMALVPDDPPLQFRWRGSLHRVKRAEGPERLAQEWWRRADQAPAVDKVRDYYRVEDATGRRFWIFRAGLYAPDVAPRWFLHGLFA